MTEIKCRVNPYMKTNAYLLVEGNNAIAIDPYPDFFRDELDELTIDYIIVTHEHYDHICGVNDWKERYGCPVICGEKAAAGLTDPRINMSHYGRLMYNVMYPGEDTTDTLGEIRDYFSKADVALGDREIFMWKGNEFCVMETPGHSAGSICLLMNGEILFCGDTLFAEIPTGVRWKGSNADDFANVAIPKLKKLDENIVVYPGHGPKFHLFEYEYWEETT